MPFDERADDDSEEDPEKDDAGEDAIRDISESNGHFLFLSSNYPGVSHSSEWRVHIKDVSVEFFHLDEVGIGNHPVAHNFLLSFTPLL